jgi:hypothetical protein
MELQTFPSSTGLGTRSWNLAPHSTMTDGTVGGLTQTGGAVSALSGSGNFTLSANAIDAPGRCDYLTASGSRSDCGSERIGRYVGRVPWVPSTCGAEREPMQLSDNMLEVWSIVRPKIHKFGESIMNVTNLNCVASQAPERPAWKP